LRRLGLGCGDAGDELVLDIRGGCRVRVDKKALVVGKYGARGQSVGAGKSRLYSSENVRGEQIEARLINDMHACEAGRLLQCILGP
jgi:hypothetical protein